MQFLNAHHRLKHASELCDIDYSIFLFRESLKKVVSCYINKFVMRKGNKDIFENYYKVTKTNPLNALFYDFLLDYLTLGDGIIDPRCWSMDYHLLPMNYSYAIDIENLHEKMKSIVGRDMSDKYFKKPSNSSNYSGIGMGASRISSEALSLIYKDTGKTPTLIISMHLATILMLFKYLHFLLNACLGSVFVKRLLLGSDELYRNP